MVHKQFINYQVLNYQNSHCELANYNHTPQMEETGKET